MAERSNMSIILRGCRAMWLSFNKTDWTCLGRDADDLSIDLNPDTETFKNVLGDVAFRNKGYTPSMTNEYRARTEDAIYENIQYITDNLATDDEHTSAEMIVATLDIEVAETTDGAMTASGKGYKVPVKIVVNTDGGTTDGYSMPFVINEDGKRVQGSVTVAERIPTFTAGGGTAEVAAYSAKSGTEASD